MTLPNALVIGPMKAGTSWVQEYLALRRDVCLPKGVKETFYFDRYFGKAPHWYEGHFRHYGPENHRRVMEVAPSYFHSAEAPRRIHDLLGEIPLIVTLRDPVQRAWSHYLHLRRKGYTQLSLREAVQEYPEILDASRYSRQLNRWAKIFGKNNLHIFLLEDLIKDPDMYCVQLCNVLDLAYADPGAVAGQQLNARGVAPSPLLAKTGRIVADGLRGRGLYFIVNSAKAMGLKEVFFGRSGAVEPPSLGEADHGLLAKELEDEVVTLDAFLEARMPRLYEGNLP